MTAGRGRGLGLVCAGSVLAAALLWAGSATVWYRVQPPGTPPVELTGAALTAVPGAIAVLALAGVAALVATRGLVRRGVGLVLALAGGVTVVATVLAATTDPLAGRGPGLLPPGRSVESLRELPLTATAAPLLAVAGAAVLLLVGLFVLVREPRLASLGARYGSAAQRRAEPDPDRAAWAALDEGQDPTLGPGGPRPERG